MSVITVLSPPSQTITPTGPSADPYTSPPALAGSRPPSTPSPMQHAKTAVNDSSGGGNGKLDPWKPNSLPQLPQRVPKENLCITSSVCQLVLNFSKVRVAC